MIGELLRRSEGEKLDFKAEQYRLDNDVLKSKLVKDIVCIANAQGDETGHIVVGVKAYPDGRKDVLGCDLHHDDADLQELVQAKVEPPPRFGYHQVKFEGKSFGLLEIPRSRSRPHIAKRDFEELRKGIVYTRHGSTNAEANREEIQAMYLDTAAWKQDLGAGGLSRGQRARQLLDRLKKEVFDTGISATQIALGCRELAVELEMKDDLEWLEAELDGYAKLAGEFQTLGELLEAKGNPDLVEGAQSRLMDIEFVVAPEGTTPLRLPWRHFFHEPLHLVETRIKEAKLAARSGNEQFMLMDHHGGISAKIADYVERNMMSGKTSLEKAFWRDIADAFRTPSRRPEGFPMKPSELSGVLDRLRHHLYKFLMRAETLVGRGE